LSDFTKKYLTRALTLKEIKYLCVIETTPIPRLNEVLHTQKSQKSPRLFTSMLLQ